MAEPVKVGFERSIAVLPHLGAAASENCSREFKQSAKFKQIARSVSEVGIIEPLVVARSKDENGNYLLLDGHMRHAVLTDIAATEVRCLIAADDEAYTYNKRINRLATVQEHFMIVRAIERGVSEEKLAKALNLDIKGIKRRRVMLVGICPEVVESVERQVCQLQNLRGAAQDEADAPDRGGGTDVYCGQLHIQLCESAIGRHSASRPCQIRRTEADRRYDARTDGAHGARDGEGPTRPQGRRITIRRGRSPVW